MNLDFMNDLFNGLKENKAIQNFAKELSEYVENNLENISKKKDTPNDYVDLTADDLEVGGKKVTAKFKDEMLVERANVLQKYAKNNGEMYYIYGNSSRGDAYNLTLCSEDKSHEVITLKEDELPEGSELGSVLRKNGEEFELDQNATKEVNEEINDMIEEKLEEQEEYLESKRVEDHVYEVGEKSDGRIWLYDLNNNAGGGTDGIEEIQFPKDLYESAEEGDLFVYKDGEYQKSE